MKYFPNYNKSLSDTNTVCMDWAFDKNVLEHELKVQAYDSRKYLVKKNSLYEHKYIILGMVDESDYKEMLEAIKDERISKALSEYDEWTKPTNEMDGRRKIIDISDSGYGRKVTQNGPTDKRKFSERKTTDEQGKVHPNITNEIRNNSKQYKLDSQGNELTKEQQEFFKDCKVRDEDH